MAPPSKAAKSDVTLKAYSITREIRRNIDNADRTMGQANIADLNAALAEARKLVTYLTTTVDNKMALAGALERGGR
jgi:hypothetical protein